jgi:cytochrome c oxidase subunit 3
MSATAAIKLPTPPPIEPERGPSAVQWGMIAFLISEVAFFSTLIAAYVAFMGQDSVGPTPKEALSLGLVIATTICLVASSGVIHFAERALHRGQQAVFRSLWALTILLGVAFLAGTAYEWREFIVDKNLTISRNLFGTTYYTLVGFHAMHVTAGVVAMLIILFLAVRREVTSRNTVGVQLIGWYWHFVDVVWLVVFCVVYVTAKSGGL